MPGPASCVENSASQSPASSTVIGLTHSVLPKVIRTTGPNIARVLPATWWFVTTWPSAEMIEKCSTEKQVSKETPPVFLLTTTVLGVAAWGWTLPVALGDEHRAVAAEDDARPEVPGTRDLRGLPINHLHILERGQRGNQLKGLENEADVLRTEHGALVFGQTVQVLAINGDRPERRVAGNLDGRQAATLAKDIGCATITLRKIEADERRPSLQLLEQVAQVFALDTAERSALLRAARAHAALAGRLSTLTVGEEVVATLLGIRCGSHYLMVRISNAGEKWSMCSPGRQGACTSIVLGYRNCATSKLCKACSKRLVPSTLID